MNPYRQFGLDAKDDFLAILCSKKHGECYLLHDDPIQLGAGLLIENLGDQRGMVIIVRGDEIAYVVNAFGSKYIGAFNFSKRDFSEASEIFNDYELKYFGILVDCGEAPDGKRRQYKILSCNINYCD